MEKLRRKLFCYYMPYLTGSKQLWFLVNHLRYWIVWLPHQRMIYNCWNMTQGFGIRYESEVKVIICQTLWTVSTKISHLYLTHHHKLGIDASCGQHMQGLSALPISVKPACLRFKVATLWSQVRLPNSFLPQIINSSFTIVVYKVALTGWIFHSYA